MDLLKLTADEMPALTDHELIAVEQDARMNCTLIENQSRISDASWRRFKDLRNLAYAAAAETYLRAAKAEIQL